MPRRPHIRRSRTAPHNGGQLTLAPQKERPRRSMKYAQPHPVAGCELQSAVVSIVVAAGVFLCLEKPSVYLGEEGIAVSEHVVDGVRAHAARLVWQECRRRSAIDHLERCLAEHGVVCLVVA